LDEKEEEVRQLREKLRTMQ